MPGPGWPSLVPDLDLNGRISAGLIRRCVRLDLRRARDYGFDARPDLELLQWAKSEQLVVLTHDAATMLRTWESMRELGSELPGLINVPQWLGIGCAIEDLQIVIECSAPGELLGKCHRLPFRVPR